MAHLFHEQDSFPLSQYFHHTFHLKEDNNSKRLGVFFLFSSTISCQYYLQLEYIVIWFHETLQSSKRSLSRLSMFYTLCSSRYQHLYYLFKPYEIR